jgi:acyl-CoA reductase-like NAD-dependent aldehyde dehydrogenase
MLQIINPATGVLIRELSSDTPESLDEKYASARTAQPTWAALGVEERCEYLRAFKARLVERIEELADILTSETGKPRQQSLNELNGVHARIDFFLEHRWHLKARS